MAKSKKQTIDREWIVTQFSRGVDAEWSLHNDALATANSPPDPSLAVLYHQIAEEDERHATLIETIATRYGYQSTGSKSGGLIERIKDAVAEIGSSPQQRLEQDLSAKASAIHWITGWIFAFQKIGDTTSADELSKVLIEEKAHHDALQQGLNLLLAKGAQGILE